ncbi:MAG: lactate racemase domain-containing protein [candidate division KSB1 bacterium]|nr:lactate racemase domain-containing protein [candidate division KSB1 bacterium]
MVVGFGGKDTLLSEKEARSVLEAGLGPRDLDGRRVLVLIPDTTRTAPVPMMFRLLTDLLLPRAAQLDFLIALGTHPVMPWERVLKHLGVTAEEWDRRYARVRVYNHRWDDPEALARLGTIPASEIEELTEGLMRQEVPVALNRLVLEYDVLIICGPTFPHEVVGFSGGNKYLFPGIAGPEIIHFFHWLGAVLTNMKIIGTKWNPVRRVVDRAAQFLQIEKLCISLVTTDEGLHGLFVGTPEDAFSAAADLSAQIHIRYVDRPYNKVLSVSPPMYDDLWTAGKCMYKLEPVVADGGELIIYAPHITEVSYTHGKILDEIGYHVRDYFLKQWDRFRHVPGGVMAHSTHVKGLGTYEDGVEKPRIQVVLATGIPEDRCRRINLGYRDPATIRLEEWQGREDEGILLVPKAGEILYRLKSDRSQGR